MTVRENTKKDMADDEEEGVQMNKRT